MSVAMASPSVILEAPDDTCGYLNGLQKATFGCHETTEKCAIYYPTPSTAARASVDATLVPVITPAPQPSIVCCEPSRGDCTVQPTACVDAFGDCTGVCSKDPMTLKCTTEPHHYCDRAHFVSPLSFRHAGALDAGLTSTDAPIDGWFCGPSAISMQHTNASHSKTASMAHMSHSPVSPTTTLSVTITLTKPGMGHGPSVSPSTTLSVTVTVSKPGLEPGPSPRPSPPAAVVSEDTGCKNDTPGSDDCCLNEQGTAEPCCYDARRARLQRRQAIDGPTTAILPAAAPGDEISRGFAIISTAYLGQTDRAPFVEATREWNVVTPTAASTSTTTTTDPRIQPSTPRRKNNRLNSEGKTAIGVTIGFVFLIVIGSVLGKDCCPRRGPRHHQHPEQNQNGHEMAGQYPGQTVGGQPDAADGGQPGPAFGRRQHVAPESGETTDVEEGLETQSEYSFEQQAYENALGIAIPDRPYNVL